jgi:cell division protein FtsX
MMEMARKQYEIIERTNVSKSSVPSLFLLDGLLQLISMLCQTQSMNEEASKQIERVAMICLENGIADSTQLLHSAKTMKSIIAIRDENVKEALEILEDSYNKQVLKLKNERAHPFLEQSIGQLGLLYKVC